MTESYAAWTRVPLETCLLPASPIFFCEISTQLRMASLLAGFCTNTLLPALRKSSGFLRAIYLPLQFDHLAPDDIESKCVVSVDCLLPLALGIGEDVDRPSQLSTDRL